MDKHDKEFDRSLTCMPDGWEEKAKELGAFTRSRQDKRRCRIVTPESPVLDQWRKLWQDIGYAEINSRTRA